MAFSFKRVLGGPRRPRPGGDVAGHTEHSHDATMLVALHLPMCSHKPLRAVGAKHTMFEIEWSAVAKGLRDDHLNPFAIRWMHALNIGVITWAELSWLEAIDHVQLRRPSDAVIEDVPFPTSFRRRMTPKLIFPEQTSGLPNGWRLSCGAKLECSRTEA